MNSFLCYLSLFPLHVSSLCALSLSSLCVSSHGLTSLWFEKGAFHLSTMKKKTKKQRLASFRALDSNRHNEKKEDGEEQVEILEYVQSGKVSSHDEMSFPSFYHEEEEEEAKVCIFSGTQFKPTSV